MVCAISARRANLCSILIVLTALPGCYSISNVKNSVPANRLPRHFLGAPKESQSPVQFASLGQEKPVEHIIGGGDTLSVYIFGIFPSDDQGTPLVQRSQQVNQRYYPPHGGIVGPATGLPVVVNVDGTIELPIVGSFQVGGLTIPEVIQNLKEAYRKEEVLAEGRERVSVTRVTRGISNVTETRSRPSASTSSLR